MIRRIDHTNIVESYNAQDVFILDILDRIANDMKRSYMEFTKDNFIKFVENEFSEALEYGLLDYAKEEWGEEE